jgi:hypothetical protein
MLEDRSALIQQVVDAELDAAFNDPAEGAVVVIGSIVYEEWIVEAVFVNRDEIRQEAWWMMGRLESRPDSFEVHGFILEKSLSTESQSI